MAIICWGNLAKAADETTRIEESISDYVERHDENVNAHQVYGSSLYMHRIQDELDHKFGSVDFKWLALNKYWLMLLLRVLMVGMLMLLPKLLVF